MGAGFSSVLAETSHSPPDLPGRFLSLDATLAQETPDRVRMLVKLLGDPVNPEPISIRHGYFALFSRLRVARHHPSMRQQPTTVRALALIR